MKSLLKSFVSTKWLLVALLPFFVFSCGKKDDDEAIVGTWKAISMCETQECADHPELESETYDEPYIQTLIFKSDGTGHISMDDGEEFSITWTFVQDDRLAFFFGGFGEVYTVTELTDEHLILFQREVDSEYPVSEDETTELISTITYTFVPKK